MDDPFDREAALLESGGTPSLLPAPLTLTPAAGARAALRVRVVRTADKLLARYIFLDPDVIKCVLVESAAGVVVSLPP